MSTGEATRSRFSASRAAVIAACVFGLLYLLTPTGNYYWDGVTFALQIEKVAEGERGPSLLFHQNHLLFNVVGYALYRAARAIEPSARALTVLRAFNAAAGGLGAGMLLLIASRLTRSLRRATASSMFLGVSAVWWKMSTDADAYVLSVLLMLTSLYAVLATRPRWYVGAGALAAAMLTHELAALFFPAALVVIFKNRGIDGRGRVAARFSLLAWSVTVGVYYLCASVFHGITSPIELIKWAASNQTGVSISPNPLGGLLLLPRASAEMIIGHSFSLFRRDAGWVDALVATATAASVLAFITMIIKETDWRAFPGSVPTRLCQRAQELWNTGWLLVVWIGSYVLFLLVWEPWQVYYRIFYAPAIALVFGFLVSPGTHATDASRHQKFARPAMLVLVSLFLFNLAFYIIPNMRVGANPLTAAAHETRARWNSRTVIYFAARNEADTTFEYFNEQTEWRRLTSGERASLETRIEQVIGSGGTVWLNKGALELMGPEWLSGRAAEEIIVESTASPARYVRVASAN